jgi:tRNA threonylcarbamoyl adenosine modification protein YjeE
VSRTADKRSASVAGTERLGAALAPALRAGDVVSLTGPLGAGKTRFVSGLVRAISPGAHVRSPSFTLVNEHAGTPPVFHLDLYRLNGVRDIEGLGLEEYAEQGVLVVEWGERLPHAWLADALEITLVPGDGDARAFSAVGRGERGRQLLDAWRALPVAW